MTDLSPVVLFAYNRVGHLRRTVEALARNDLALETCLYVYCDGYKVDSDVYVRQVREYVGTIAGFKNVNVVFRTTNLGIEKNVISGVGEVLAKHSKAIVLEDDLVTAPNFLAYMNEALDKYRLEPSVFSISGYSYDKDATGNKSYFLPLTTSWGWATWEDRFRSVDFDDPTLGAFLRSRANRRQLDFDGSFPFSKMARQKTWDIYWYYTAIKTNRLTLFPAQSLVQNIGFDGTGANFLGTNDSAVQRLLTQPPPRIAVDPEAQERVKAVFLKANRWTLSVKSRIGRILSNRARTQLQVALNRMRTFGKRRNVGKDTFIDKTVHVDGWRSVQIGAGTSVSEGTWLNANSAPGLIRIHIGNSCYIGRRNFFTAGNVIDLRDFVMTGIGCQLLGGDHDISDPLIPHILSETTESKWIKLGVNVRLGAEVTVLGDVEIGHGSIIGARSVVTRSVPPFSLVVGSPAKVIKRFCFIRYEWVPVDEFTPEMESFLPSEAEYLGRIKRRAGDLRMPLMASTRIYGDSY